ncbi:uncharacterized protein LOC106649324 [Trichogramma pretiosum]|uniref:uncharacterized protein LOC106649324 n=1 Tax=Trichogramma pretiosum TaxID=7493 RepID=UPI0006C9A51D|nr:uncharacterized protein LOC106649324 [Trichogramma pretiosum]
MKLRSNSTNSTGVKRGLIDAFDERSSNAKSLKINQGDVKRISHFYDKDIEIDVECHYENFKKENVKVEPDVHIKSEKEFEDTQKRVKVEDKVYVKNEKISEFKNFKVEPDLHIKSEKEFEVNSKSNFRTLENRKIISGQAAQKRIKIEADVYIKNENITEFKNFKVELDLFIKSEKECKVNTEKNFRTLRNRKINLAEQAPPKNVNITKEKIIEENIQHNSEDIQRASHNYDKEIAELIEFHDVQPEKANEVYTKHNLFEQAALEIVDMEVEKNVVNKKVIEVDLVGNNNKKKGKKTLENHRKCCQSYESLLNCLEKFNRNRGCRNCTLCFFHRGFCVEFYQLVHVIVVKNEIKKCICHECGMEFTNISILKVHIDYTHTKCFTSPIILKWHNKTSNRTRFIPVQTL